MCAVSAVHEQVKERTGEQQKEKTGSQHMSAMLCEQQESPNRKQDYKANANPRRQEIAFYLLSRACMVMMRHVTLPSRTSSFALDPAPNGCERSSRKTLPISHNSNTLDPTAKDLISIKHADFTSHLRIEIHLINRGTAWHIADMISPLASPAMRQTGPAMIPKISVGYRTAANEADFSSAAISPPCERSQSAI